VTGDVPPAVVTMTSTIEPLVRAGACPVMDVSLVTVKEVAAVPPKVTEIAPVNYLPEIVTAEVAPPALVTTGVGYS